MWKMAAKQSTFARPQQLKTNPQILENKMSETMQGNIGKAKPAFEAEPEYEVHTAQPSLAELDYEGYQQDQAEYFGSLPNDVQDALLQYGAPKYDPQAIAAIQQKLTKEPQWVDRSRSRRSLRSIELYSCLNPPITDWP